MMLYEYYGTAGIFINQRTATFLRLDESRGDILFEKSLTTEWLTSLPDNLTKHSLKEIIDEIIKN